MFLTDYHMHSLCSPDGSAPLAAMAQAALKAGLAEICLTDHCDLLDGYGKPDCSFTWAGVEEQLALARPLFAGRLPIRMGLELGEPWMAPDFAAELCAHPELDFVIGSIHNLHASHGGQDFYYVHYDSEEICYTVLDSYFLCMEELVRMDCLDVLAHIVYPLRYMNDRDGNHVSLEPYYPRLAGIFRTLIARGKGIELNTTRGRQIDIWRPILALYKDCGGELVTLGSDAHTPEDVGKGIPAGAALLKEYGLKLTLFEKRQPKPVTL